MTRLLAAILALTLPIAPLAAQDAANTPPAQDAADTPPAQDAAGEVLAPDPAPEPPVPVPDEGRLVIDILAPKQLTPEDIIAAQACEAEQDAARLRGEIIVCRRLNDGSAVSGFDKRDWERRYAEKTQGMKTPDVAGAGGTILTPGEGSLATITVTQKGCYLGPCAPEKALIIDVGALPAAPPGSDADRIARGLEPLGDEGGD